MLYVKDKKPTNPTEEELDNYYAANEEKLRSIDKNAAKKGTIVHRVIKEETKTGIALYQITKYGLKNAKVRFCDGLSPEDIPAEYFGKEALISLEYAESSIKESPAFPENNIYLKEK